MEQDMANLKQPKYSEPALFIGIDWADQKHDCCVILKNGEKRFMEFAQTPEAIEQWVAKMNELAKGQKIAIILEQSKGPLIHALMHRPNLILYPINPKRLAKYRESFPGGEAKDDPTDAMYLARMLRERIDILKPWLPNDEKTRLLNKLCEQRRWAVNAQTKLRQQLLAVLKHYFPGVLELFGKRHQQRLLISVLKRWPDPRQLRRADPRVIRRVLKEHGVRNSERQQEVVDYIRSMKLLTKDDAVIAPLAMAAKLLAKQMEVSSEAVKQFDTCIARIFEAHQDKHLFKELRGAGPALAPRLLCAFGSDRDRWANADELAAFSGEAPVTRRSGQQKGVFRRYACPKHLRQTFHEFAESARQWCPWTKARYRLLKEKGMKHHAILRKLARSWIRILFRVWKTRIPFNCDRYIENLKKRSPEIIPYLKEKC